MTEKLDPSKYIREIAVTEAYRESQSRIDQLRGLVPESEIVQRRKHAVHLGASSLTHQEKSGYMSRDGHVFDVISRIESFATSSQQLQRLEDLKALRTVREPHLKNVAEFNHSIKGLIDRDPALGFADLAIFIRNMHRAVSGPEKAPSFEHMLVRRLNGTRHELGFEQIVASMDDVEYQDSDVEGDLHGVDISVLIDDVWLDLDVKASERTAQEDRRDSRHPELIIWSHLTDADFGDRFTIGSTLARAKAGEVRNDLERIAEYLQATA